MKRVSTHDGISQLSAHRQALHQRIRDQAMPSFSFLNERILMDSLCSFKRRKEGPTENFPSVLFILSLQWAPIVFLFLLLILGPTVKKNEGRAFLLIFFLLLNGLSLKLLFCPFNHKRKKKGNLGKAIMLHLLAKAY